MDRVRGLGGARARAGTGVFAGPGRPAKGTQGAGAHARWPGRFRESRAPRQRNAKCRRARAGPGVFAGPGRPAKVTHDMFCILGTRVTLNASLRLDSLRSLGSARVSRQSRGVQGSGRPAPLKPQPGYAQYPTAVPRVIARAGRAPPLNCCTPRSVPSVSCWGVWGGAARSPHCTLHDKVRFDVSGAERAKRVEAERSVQGHPSPTNTKHIVRYFGGTPCTRENAWA
jgi:hypothetical protein